MLRRSPVRPTGPPRLLPGPGPHNSRCAEPTSRYSRPLARMVCPPTRRTRATCFHRKMAKRMPSTQQAGMKTLGKVSVTTMVPGLCRVHQYCTQSRGLLATADYHKLQTELLCSCCSSSSNLATDAAGARDCVPPTTPQCNEFHVVTGPAPASLRRSSGAATRDVCASDDADGDGLQGGPLLSQQERGDRWTRVVCSGTACPAQSSSTPLPRPQL